MVPRPDAGAASPEPADAAASQIVSNTTTGLSIAIDGLMESRSISQFKTTVDALGLDSIGSEAA